MRLIISQALPRLSDADGVPQIVVAFSLMMEAIPIQERWASEQFQVSCHPRI
jgi:hypothetical protein